MATTTLISVEEATPGPETADGSMPSQVPFSCDNHNNKKTALKVEAYVSYVKGYVTIKKGTSLAEQLNRDDVINAGHTIQTSKTGFVRLRIGDRHINIQPESVFAIDRYRSNCHAATIVDSHSLEVSAAHISAAVRG